MTFCKIRASHYMHLKTNVLTFIHTCILIKDILHSNCKIGIMFIHVLISLIYLNGDYQYPLPSPLHVRSFFWMQYCSGETMFNGMSTDSRTSKKSFLGRQMSLKVQNCTKVHWLTLYMYIKITPILEYIRTYL